MNRKIVRRLSRLLATLRHNRRADVQRIERSRNLSVIAWFRQRACREYTRSIRQWAFISIKTKWKGFEMTRWSTFGLRSVHALSCALPHPRLLTTNFVASSDIPRAMRLFNLNVLLRTS